MALGSLTPEPLPPLSAEFESSADPAGGQGGAPQKWKLSRCSSGKSMIDYGNKTVITDPKAQQVITLDHVKKEALVVPLPPAQGKLPGMIPGMPQVPSLQTPSPAHPIDVKDLGKKLIGGHEAEGKLYTFRPPQLPQPPGLTPPQPHQPPGLKPPQLHQPPGLKPPQLPQPPGLKLPQLAHTVEVWTSSKLHLPLLTKSGSGAAQHTTTCKQVTAGEPPGCSLQIPPDYEVVHPPSMPNLPASPPLPRA